MKHEMTTQFLRDELQLRLKRNPRYSLRAFAKLLQTNNGTLSSILSGRRPLTAKTAVQFCERLNISPRKRNQILDALINKHNEAAGATHTHSQAAPSLRRRAEIERALLDRTNLENELFSAMAEWQHMAILQLVRTDAYRKGPAFKRGLKWLAARLGETETTIKIAIDRLVQLGLLEKRNERYWRTKEKLTTANKSVSTPALRSLQKALRLKSIESLENDPVETRTMTSMTMAVALSKLPEARELIEEFQERMSALLESEKKEQVYQLTVSLFPLEKGEPR